jgi:hypothetical protein
VLQVVLLLTQTVYTSAQCSRGYIRVKGAGPCTACAAGKYHEAVGSNTCWDCSSGTYSTVVGATSESTCIECDYNAGLWTLDGGSTRCICQSGFYGPNGTAPCTRCPSGLVTQDFGMTQCVACPEGLHPDRQNRNCEECPSPQVQPPGGDRWDTCVCRTGFVFYDPIYRAENCPTCPPIEYGCTGCQPGYYQDKIGESFCIECPTGMSSSYYATTCTGCPDNMWFWTSMNICVCNTGYIGPRGGPCIQCPAGTYQFLRTETEDKGGCSNCQPGSYQDQLGQPSCVQCVVGTYSNTSSATACVACPDNANSNIPRDACDCNAGYVGPEFGPCTPCAAGTYDSLEGGCWNCQPGSYQDQLAQTSCIQCVVGTYSNTSSATACVACPDNTNSNIPRDACDCNAGYVGPDFGPCTPCVPGSYKDATGFSDCTDCPSGTYSTTPAATECLICGEHSWTPTRSSSVDACVCEVGHGIR